MYFRYINTKENSGPSRLLFVLDSGTFDSVVHLTSRYLQMINNEPIHRKTDVLPLLISIRKKNSQRFSLVSETISNIAKAVMREAGIDLSQYTPHSIRGAAASAALLLGTSKDKVQELARWSKKATTMERVYSKPVKWEREQQNTAESDDIPFAIAIRRGLALPRRNN